LIFKCQLHTNLSFAVSVFKGALDEGHFVDLQFINGLIFKIIGEVHVEMTYIIKETASKLYL